MAFNTYCTNKGCKEYQAPYLDPSTNKVHCSICDGEIENLTPFAKNQMKMAKQFKKKPQSFLVKCNFCKKSDRPKLEKDKILCSYCNKEITSISEPFKMVLKQYLNKPED